MQRYITLSVHWIVHWTLCIVCVCSRADICNKYMCIVYNAIVAVAVMPSIQNWCLLLLFSLFIFSLRMLFSYYYFFVHLFLADFVFLFEYKMLTKMVVNTDAHTHTRKHAYFLHYSIAFDLAVISVRCQHILIVAIRIHMASLMDVTSSSSSSSSWSQIFRLKVKR